MSYIYQNSHRIAKMEWLKVLRLKTTLLAPALVISGFRLSRQPIEESFWPAIIVFFISCASVVWNDYCNRRQDVYKKKFLAYLEPKTFLVYAMSCWGIVLIFVVLLGLWQSVYFAALVLLGVIMGLIYPMARRVLALNNLIVAIAAACSLGFALAGDRHSITLWLVFAAVVLIIFCREAIKDIDNRRADKRIKALYVNKEVKNFKNTLAMKIGVRDTRLLISFLLLIPFFLFIIASTNQTLIGALAALSVIIILITGGRHNIAKSVMDFGIMLFLVVTLFPGF